MYKDDYVEIQQLESEASQQDVCKAPPPLKNLTYSTGKFKNGAVGLCNIGVTSCLNPLLQTLYMYKEFTDILCRIGEPEDKHTEKRLAHELLALFEEMQDSKEDAVPPYRVLCCLQMLEVTLFAKMDVGDVFSSFWNHLLQNMPGPQLEEKLRALYTISLEEHLTCQRCLQKRSAHCELLSLPLRVSHSKYHRNLTLEGALWRYFHFKELYEDKNFCSKCERNSWASKVTHFRSLPRTLTVHLKRLYKSGSEVQKVNRTFSFPPVLDLLEILSPEQLPEDEQPTTHYCYHLLAVIAHSGTANFGHYSAYIKSCKDGGWYFFNDSSVCKVSWDDVKCTYGNTAFHWGATASLLFYVQSNTELTAVTSGSRSPM